MSYSYVGFQCPLCYEDHKHILKIFRESKGLINHLFKSHTPSREYIESIKQITKNLNGKSVIKICLERGILR